METMTLEQMYYIAEILGIFIVIGSLLFVGIQIRQNTRVIKLSATQNVSHEFREALGIIAADTEMADLHLRGSRDTNFLSPAEKHRFFIFLNNIYRVYENTYYQYQQGVLDSDIWNGMLTQMAFPKNTPGYLEFWDERKQIFSKEFQTFYENEVPGLPAEKLLSSYQKPESQQ